MKMDLIYSAAEIAIVSATGSSSSYGLSGAGPTNRTPLKSIKISNSLAFVPIKYAKDCISQSVWATRAWTLQEGLLARRRLVFTPEQIYFECQEMQTAETISVPFNDVPQSSTLAAGYFFDMGGRHGHDAPYDRISRFLHYYSRRELSYSTDRLNAFLGILNSMKPAISHVWGLPISLGGDIGAKESFVSSLGWEHKWSWFKDNETPLKQQLGFPSWSWAAWKGPKDLHLLRHTEDVQVKLQLNGDSIIDLCSTESIKDHLEDLEVKAPTCLLLQTFVLRPKNLTKKIFTLYAGSSLSINPFDGILHHYLGKEKDELVIAGIRNGTFKLLYIGSNSYLMKFIIGRTNQESLVRVGVLNLPFGESQDVMEYLRVHADFMRVDLM